MAPTVRALSTLAALSASSLALPSEAHNSGRAAVDLKRAAHPWDAPQRLFLQLAACNSSDGSQQWDGAALDRPGVASTLVNRASKLCVVGPSLTNTIEPYAMAPCDGASTQFNYSNVTNQFSILPGGTDCLDGNGGSGPSYIRWNCHPPDHKDYPYQQLVYDRGTGLLHSKPNPERCLTMGALALPRLRIHPRGFATAGASSGGDFAIQMHVAFSASIFATCGFDAQPFHCAVTRFPGDQQVPLTAESSVPHCQGCDPGYTLIYDHCKNHPEWVDVGMLPDYPRRTCGSSPSCLDDVVHLYNSTVYVSRGECNTYVGGAVVNTIAMYAQMMAQPSKQVSYTDQCSPEGQGVDIGEACFQHIWARGPRGGLLPAAAVGKKSSVGAFEQAPFLEDFNAGFATTGWYYLPDQCRPGSPSLPADGCLLVFRFHGCGGTFPPSLDDTMVRYAESNGIVLVYPVILPNNNVTSFYRDANEIGRGCWDGYGQLTEDYALQRAPHMRSVWRMIEQIMGPRDLHRVLQTPMIIAS